MSEAAATLLSFRQESIPDSPNILATKSVLFRLKMKTILVALAFFAAFSSAQEEEVFAKLGSQLILPCPSVTNQNLAQVTTCDWDSPEGKVSVF